MRRRFVILAVAVLALNAFFWLGSLAIAAQGAGGPLGFLFGPRLVRAEVVLRNGAVYDVYRGRIVVARPNGFAVREADGRVDRFTIDPSTRILGGSPARGLRVTVVAASNGPVTLVVVGR